MRLMRGVMCCAMGVITAAGVAAEEPAASTMHVVTRPLIAGLWAMPIKERNCTEYYNFKENGEFLIRSAEERVIGKYDYELPKMGEDSKLPLLTIHIKYDNLAADCAGRAIDQRNEVQQQFIKWSNPPYQIQFCSTMDGSRCEATLAKVLP